MNGNIPLVPASYQSIAPEAQAQDQQLALLKPGRGRTSSRVAGVAEGWTYYQPGGNDELPEDPMQSRKIRQLDSDQRAHDRLRTFDKALHNLVDILSGQYWVDGIECCLEQTESVQKMMDILPEPFLRLLQDSPDELLAYPHKYIKTVLDDAVSAIKQSADVQVVSRLLCQYFDTLLMACDQNMFMPRDPGDARLHNDLLKDLFHLPLSIWQRNMDGIMDLVALGSDPWKDSRILAAIGSRSSYSYNANHSGDSSGSGPGDDSRTGGEAHQSRRPQKVFDIFEPPWAKYGNRHSKPVLIDICHDYGPVRKIREQINRLNELEAGFYCFDDYYLYVGDSNSLVRFSVYLPSGLYFNYQAASQLYDFLTQNQILFTHIYQLKYSPKYFITGVNSGSNTGDISDEIRNALQILDIKEENLPSLTEKELNTHFRKQSRHCHPDKLGTNDSVPFLQLKNALETVLVWLEVSSG